MSFDTHKEAMQKLCYLREHGYWDVTSPNRRFRLVKETLVEKVLK